MGCWALGRNKRLHSHREFAVYGPSVTAFEVVRTRWRLVVGDPVAQCGCILRQLHGLARRGEQIVDDPLNLRLRVVGAIDRAGTEQRHMLPRPRLLALIAFEAVERDHQGALRALRTQPRIDVVELSRRSEEHTSELQSLMRISYAVFCLKKKTKTKLITEK